MHNNVLYSSKGGIATVTINRAAVRNALNSETIRELSAVFDQIRSDEAIRVVILTGSGDRAFVAGADIQELAELAQRSTEGGMAGKDYAQAGQKVFQAIENLGKPVIAAVNGFALGGGCELAMACTFRIASENAVFGQPEVKLGIIPGYGGTQRLTRLVGKGRALQILLTGDAVTSDEALRIGLVNQVVPAAELVAAAEAIAKKIMGNAPLAVRFCLDAVHRGMQMTDDEGQSVEAALFGLCCASEDMKEGTHAFLEKRAANFRGR